MARALLAAALLAGLAPAAVAHGVDPVVFVGPVEVAASVTRVGGPVSFGALAPGAEAEFRLGVHSTDGTTYRVHAAGWRGGLFHDDAPVEASAGEAVATLSRAFRVPDDAPRGERAVAVEVVVLDAGRPVANATVPARFLVGAPLDGAPGVAAVAVVFAVATRRRQ